jgi:hypothetical protein
MVAGHNRGLPEMKRGQFSVETIFIIAISSAFLIPMMYFFYDFLTSSSDGIVQNQLARLGQGFIDTANTVYNYGDGTKIVVDYSFPDKILNMSIQNNDTLVFKTGSKSGPMDLSFPFGINVTGNFSPSDYATGRKEFEFLCIDRGERVSVRRIYR